MAKIPVVSLSFVALAFSAMTACAGPAVVSNEAQALYFKALPYLDSIDDEDNKLFNLRRHLPEGETFPEQLKTEYKNTLRQLLNEAGPLIRRSADAGNPAAQHRLAALLAAFEPREDVVEHVCSLLKSSLKQGFAPAGLRMLSYCFEEVKTAEFRAMIDALPPEDTQYRQYYPQPVVMQICKRARGTEGENALVRLDAKAVRAELYLSLSTQMANQNLKTEQQRYRQKAADYGCARALQRLSTDEAGS